MNTRLKVIIFLSAYIITGSVVSNNFKRTKVNRETKSIKLNEKTSTNGRPKLSYKKPDYVFMPFDLKHLAEAEDKIYQMLQTHVQDMEEQLTLMKRYLQDYEDSSVKETEHLNLDVNEKQWRRPEIISFNPLLSHKMIRRFVFYFHEIIDSLEINSNANTDLLKKINNANRGLFFPNDSDLKDSYEAILRIQHYYEYKATNFGNGIFDNVNTHVHLNSKHAIELAEYANLTEKYSLAVEWYNYALNKISFESDNSYTNMEELIESLNVAILAHDIAWERSNDSGRLFVFSNRIKDAPHELVKLSSKIRIESKTFSGETYNQMMLFKYITLCSGENLQTESEKSKLYCWYESQIHPYLFINPSKMELLNSEPYLVQIYEVVGDQMLAALKVESIPVLRRAAVIDYGTFDGTLIQDIRTSSNGWLGDDSLTDGKNKLEKKIEFLTGLAVEAVGASEIFQIASYAFGGHYDTHLDAIQDDERTKKYGDRIATFMIYMNDVEMGGYTSFPVLGTAARPIKGSAVFWYNMKKNGNTDRRTWHGACPLIMGHKWVANKWINFNQNFQSRKCSLDPNE